MDAIFETFRRMHSTLKKQYALKATKDDYDEFESSQFNLLLANPHGAFLVHPDRAVSEVATFYAFGSGFRYALGAMHAVYPTLERPEAVAQAGVEAAAELDEDTGAPVEVHRIELTGDQDTPNPRRT